MVAPVTAYAYFLAIMVLTLAFFMMAVSWTQKMKELTWEQGVLRSIGLTKAQNNKIFYYEAFCIVISAFVSGLVVGIFAVYLLSSLFSTIIELPKHTVIDTPQIAFNLAVVSFATFLAVKGPATLMNAKQISSVLKGIDN